MKRYIWIFFGYMFIVVICLFILSSINGNKVFVSKSPWLEKYLSRTYVDGLSTVLEHEAFTNSNIKSKNNKVILTGSCQLKSLWCTKDVIKTQCSIASLLEQSLVRDNLPVSVMNLSVSTNVVGHNLHIFLRFLNNPKYKIFVWHNEAGPTVLSNSLFNHSNKDIASFLPYIYNQLGFLMKKHADIDELFILNKRIKENFENIHELEETYLPERDMGAMESVIYNAKYTFGNIIDLNISEVIFHIRKNTEYLRSFKKRIDSIKARISPKTSYVKYEQELQGLDVKPYEKMFYTGGNVPLSNDKLHYDNILILKIIDKLAGLYKKKVYFYIGPEAQCQNDNHFTKTYYNPMIELLSTLSNIKLMDLSGMEITPQRESFNCINMTYLGNKKIANKIYEIFTNKDMEILK
ncbi:hypothetical protein HOO14_07350 [bacterium]|jgi:hypothetical protein|nr:hypothetical protein [bacterium]